MPDAREQATDDRATGDRTGGDAVALVERARGATTDEELAAALGAGLVRVGRTFLDLLADLAPDLVDAATLVFLGWLSGERLTDRADEAELRAAAALELLEESDENATIFGRFVATAILELAVGHEARDVGLAHECLVRALEASRDEDDVEEELRTIRELLAYELEPAPESEQLIGTGLALLPRCESDEAATRFVRAAFSYAQARAIEARDADDDAGFAHWADRADDLIALIDSSADAAEDLRNLVALAGQHDLRERWAEAAELYRTVVERSSLENPTVHFAARREGELRLRLGDYDRAVEVLRAVLPLVEEHYLTAVLDAEVRLAGGELADTGTSLALAHAYRSEWGEAFRALDTVKSRRLRHAAALRSGTAGRDLLELERLLDAAARGVAVPLDAGAPDADDADVGLTLRTRLLETYRRTRAQLPEAFLADPSVEEVARVLEAGEAVVAVGVHWKATLALVVTRHDRGSPSGHVLAEEWTLRRWVDAFRGEDGEGWILALGAPELEFDRGRALARLLEEVDEALGRPLAVLLRRLGARRVTIVPHGLLHLVPYWAVPSLTDLDVLTAPSAAQLVRARTGRAGVLDGRATIVSNPTFDLPVSSAEGAAVARALAAAGIASEVLERADATKRAIAAGAGGTSILHFSGHGQSDLVEPVRSALRVAPVEGVAGAAEMLAGALAAAEEWDAVVDADGEADDDAFFADVPGLGRLYERALPEGDRYERRLEQAERTLWGSYVDDRLVAVGELWTAGDLMVRDPFAACGLAVLSACESGVGGAAALDEHGGIPAALELAGVSTVVATLWPVLDPIAALYVGLFYEQLAETHGAVDVPAVVARARTRLGAMRRSEAQARLLALRDGAADARAALTLEAFAHELEGRPDPPFGDPWEWAPFAVTGNPILHRPARGESDASR